MALLPMPMAFVIGASKYHLLPFPCCSSVCHFPPFLCVNPFLPALPLTMPPLSLPSIPPRLAGWITICAYFQFSPHIMFCLLDQTFFQHLILALLPKSLLHPSWHIQFWVSAAPRWSYRAVGNRATLSYVWDMVLFLLSLFSSPLSI